jgi:hypothetical protein
LSPPAISESSIGVMPSCRRPHIAAKTVAARGIVEDELTMKSTPVPVQGRGNCFMRPSAAFISFDEE